MLCFGVYFGIFLDGVFVFSAAMCQSHSADKLLGLADIVLRRLCDLAAKWQQGTVVGLEWSAAVCWPCFRTVQKL